MDQKHQKCPKQRDKNIMSYVSHDMRKYTTIGQKKKENAPQQRDKYCKMFLSPLTVRLIQKNNCTKFYKMEQLLRNTGTYPK